MRILLSNDDGVHAAGIRALYRQLSKLGDVTVVAPLEERSTTGHSLTIHKPLRIIEVEKNFFGVSGSPADCVYLGIRQVLKKVPDLVVSGINRGANLGQDIYYSGTVAAAREASIIGVPSLAVSLVIDPSANGPEKKFHYDTAARMAVRLLQQIKKLDLPKATFLNLNVPDTPLSKVRGFRFTRQGFRYYGGQVLHRKDHRGRDYYWLGGRYKGFCRERDTDCLAVEQGYASVTPLKLDSTDLPLMVSLSESEWR